MCYRPIVGRLIHNLHMNHIACCKIQINSKINTENHQYC